jgi:hypothetical protein
MTAVHRSLRNTRVSVVLAAFGVLALLGSGCGGGGERSSTTAPGSAAAAQAAQDRIRQFGLEATGSQAKQAEATLHGYMDARVAGEWKEACTYLAKPIRRLFDRLGSKSKQVNGKGCAGFVETSTRKLTPSERAGLAKVDVTSVRVEGEQGYILYRDPSGAEYSMSLRREAGTWKLLGIGGTSLS